MRNNVYSFKLVEDKIGFSHWDHRRTHTSYAALRNQKRRSYQNMGKLREMINQIARERWVESSIQSFWKTPRLRLREEESEGC